MDNDSPSSGGRATTKSPERTARNRKTSSRPFFPNKKIRVPRVGTSACRSYFESFQQINEFVTYVTGMAIQIEQVAERAHRALIETARDESKKEQLLKDWEERKGRGAVRELKKHRQLFMEVVLVRHIDNYLNYLSSVLMEILCSTPRGASIIREG